MNERNVLYSIRSNNVLEVGGENSSFKLQVDLNGHVIPYIQQQFRIAKDDTGPPKQRSEPRT